MAEQPKTETPAPQAAAAESAPAAVATDVATDAPKAEAAVKAGLVQRLLSMSTVVLSRLPLPKFLKRVAGEDREGAHVLLTAVWSRDSATRWMGMVFVLCACGAIVSGYVVWSRYSEHLKRLRDTKAGQHLGEFIGKQAEEAKRRHTTLNIGAYTVELKAVPGIVAPRGVNNMAQLELIVECDTKTTCAFLQDNHVAVRNQLTNVFTALEREELMSIEGKKRIKRRIIDRINSWLPSGRVERIYIVKLAVG